MNSVPYGDLNAQYATYRDELQAAVPAVLEHRHDRPPTSPAGLFAVFPGTASVA